MTRPRSFRSSRQPLKTEPRVPEPTTPLIDPLPAAPRMRGFVAEGVIFSTPLDPYMSLRALTSYSGLSIRTLRDHLGDPLHPLPCFRVGGKILVRRSEFDTWVERFRQAVPAADVGRLVADVLRDL